MPQQYVDRLSLLEYDLKHVRTVSCIIIVTYEAMDIDASNYLQD